MVEGITSPTMATNIAINQAKMTKRRSARSSRYGRTRITGMSAATVSCAVASGCRMARPVMIASMPMAIRAANDAIVVCRARRQATRSQRP
jgi:hypothetical protein